MLDDWVRALAAELDVPAPADLDLLLDTAGTAAHAVERPAAPITTYLLGYAAAAGTDRGISLDDIAERVRRLADHWRQARPGAE